MYMVFVLHSLYQKFENLRNEVLTNLNIPTTEELINHLLWISWTDEPPKSNSEVDSTTSLTKFCHQERRHGTGGHGTSCRVFQESIHTCHNFLCWLLKMYLDLLMKDWFELLDFLFWIYTEKLLLNLVAQLTF